MLCIRLEANREKLDEKRGLISREQEREDQRRRPSFQKEKGGGTEGGQDVTRCVCVYGLGGRGGKGKGETPRAKRAHSRCSPRSANQWGVGGVLWGGE